MHETCKRNTWFTAEFYRRFFMQIQTADTVIEISNMIATMHKN
jgi:hypothetical protein